MFTVMILTKVPCMKWVNSANSLWVYDINVRHKYDNLVVLVTLAGEGRKMSSE
jgi:hypothetical protein